MNEIDIDSKVWKTVTSNPVPITQQKEQLASLQKMDEKIEEISEAEVIGDGVF